MDRLKTNSVDPQNDTEYSELHHKTGRLQGPSRSPRGVHNQGNKEEYGQLDPSQVQSNSARNNESVKTSKKATLHAGKAYMYVVREIYKMSIAICKIKLFLFVAFSPFFFSFFFFSYLD